MKWRRPPERSDANDATSVDSRQRDLRVACGQIETDKDDANALTNPVVLDA